MTSLGVAPTSSSTASTDASDGSTLQQVRRVAGVVGGVAVLYAVTTLLRYLVGGLHRVPLADVAGGLHDPKDLWPQGWLAAPMAAGASLAMLLLLPVALVAGARSLSRVVGSLRSRDRAVTVAASATAFLCAGLVALALSPLGTTLVAWRMD